MKLVIRLSVFLLVAGGTALNSFARNEDGTLGLIRTPNNGIPVIITNTDVFEAVLEEEARLSLVGPAGRFDLETTWTPHPGALMLGQCQLKDTPPSGAYTLHAVTAGRTDANVRSVYVLDAFPEAYLVAHITDTHIGTTRHPRADVDIVQDVIEAVNTSEAAFVLVTGDVTENGTPEQFRRFMEVLDTCRLPTYVIPGNHDRKDSNYQDFFGPMVYAFSFGQDGYLGFDTKDFLIADEMGLQDGRLHYLRRTIRASRWSIGFTHRYDVTMGMRAQLTLFVDDPLDYLLYGHYHREAGDQDGIPWGGTHAIMTPAAINGTLRFVGVDANGMRAQAVVTAASITENAE